jgi:hypothetical protein
VAFTTLKLGPAAGTNTVTATVAGLTGSPVTFNATARVAATIAAVSGNLQGGIRSTPLASPFVVVVRDASSNPVPGVQVTFAAASGGGTVSNALVFTDAQGRAFTLLTLGGTPGSNQVNATVTGLTGSPVIFTANGS